MRVGFLVRDHFELAICMIMEKYIAGGGAMKRRSTFASENIITGVTYQESHILFWYHWNIVAVVLSHSSDRVEGASSKRLSSPILYGAFNGCDGLDGSSSKVLTAARKRGFITLCDAYRIRTRQDSYKLVMTMWHVQNRVDQIIVWKRIPTFLGLFIVR